MEIRVLGLGNDLLADDAFGLAAARALEREAPAGVEIVCSSAAGLSLLDFLQGADRVLVIDAWQRGGPPGSIYQQELDAQAETQGGDADARPPLASSLHYLGLADALALGRRLGLPMPAHVVCLGVEPADCRTIGGAMGDAVRGALPRVVGLARDLLRQWQQDEAQRPAR